MNSHALISVVKLCNAGCTVIFTKINCIVTYRGRIVLEGLKCNRTGLWMIPLSQSITPTDLTMEAANTATTFTRSTVLNLASNIVETSSREELAMFYHQIMGSPPKSTLLKAIKNNQLQSFPGLTYGLIKNHLPPSTATHKGHMTRKRKGVQSTKNKQDEILDARRIVDDMNPPEQMCTALDDKLFCFSLQTDKLDTLYTDLCGRFPVRSFGGHNYVFVGYHYRTNAILIEPMKDQGDREMERVFNYIYEYLTERGHKPRLHILDNQCSKAIKKTD